MEPAGRSQPITMTVGSNDRETAHVCIGQWQDNWPDGRQPDRPPRTEGLAMRWCDT